MENTGKLLFDESPLIVQRKLAMKLGVDEALFIQQLHYLIVGKQSGSDFSTFKEGNVWVYNTWWGWQEFFPFWNEKKIKRMIKSLEEVGVLIGRTDLNVKAYDKTKWYRIDYELLVNLPERNYFEEEGSLHKEKKMQLLLKPKGQNVPMSNSKGSNGTKENAEPSNPHEQPKGQNVPIDRDILSLPIPKISIQKNSLNNLESKYVGSASLELYLSQFNMTKYASIELTKLVDAAGEILVTEAIKRAVSGEANKPIAYIKSTVSKWVAAECQTIEDIERYEDNFRQQQVALKQQKKVKHGKRTTRKEDLAESIREEKKAPSTEEQLTLEEERRRLEEELKQYKRS
jgi:DNA replication protein DnaD